MRKLAVSLGIAGAVLAVGLYSVVAGPSTFNAAFDADPNSVARADVPMIVLPAPVPRASSDPVSQLIAQPVRIIDKTARSHNLTVLVTDALSSLGYNAGSDDPLRNLLVQTLAERQTDAYIDVALNTALSRGQIALPPALVSATGDLDTTLLLNTVLAQLDS